MKTKKTKQQRKMAVLRDALKQLNAKNMIARPGDVVFINNEEFDHVMPEEQAQKFINKLFKKGKAECQVCARGCLLLSTINKENSFTNGQLSCVGGSFNKDSITDNRLMKLFTDIQLQMMENAFETSHQSPGINFGYNSNNLDIDNAIKSHEFGSRYSNPNNRLKAILENTIKNKGTFKP